MKNIEECSLSLSDPSAIGVARLKEKRSQFVYQLGKLVDDLSRAEAIQFLFVSEYQNAEKEIQQLLEKMNDLDERIRLQGGSITDEDEPDFVFAAPRGTTIERQEEPERESVTSVASNEDRQETESISREETVGDPMSRAASYEALAPEDSESQTRDSEMQARDFEPEAADPEPEVIKEELVVSAEKREQVIHKTTSVVEESACEKLPHPEPQTEPEAHDYWELSGTLHFDVPSEERRFEQLLTLMNSAKEAERLRGFNRIACSFGRECIYRVARLAVRDPHAVVRAAVLKMLSRLNEDQAAEIYHQALHDPESSIRISAIKGASMFLFEKSFSLLRPLLDDKDPEVRSSAVSYLGLYCQEAGMAAVAATRKDPSPLVRKSVANILGIVKPPKAVMLLEEMLSDNVPEVEKAVEASLSKVFKYKPVKRF